MTFSSTNSSALYSKKKLSFSAQCCAWKSCKGTSTSYFWLTNISCLLYGKIDKKIEPSAPLCMWWIGCFRQFMRLLLFLGDACARTGGSVPTFTFSIRNAAAAAAAPPRCDSTMWPSLSWNIVKTKPDCVCREMKTGPWGEERSLLGKRALERKWDYKSFWGCTGVTLLTRLSQFHPPWWMGYSLHVGIQPAP